MPRTTTYVRISGEELASTTPEKALADAVKAGSFLHIEDARRGARIPDDWLQVAHKVTVRGRVLKDHDGLAE